MTDIMENACGRIAVIGGGASGCMAAIAAARAGCRVTIFEKNEKLAKKIYATGNGRCNLTNLFLDESCYHSREADDPSRIFLALEAFSREDLLGFFAEAGVPVHDRDGYVYPRTDQAETIAKALEKCLRRAGVEILTLCDVLEINKQEDIFCVRYADSSAQKTALKAAGEDRGKNVQKSLSFAGKNGRIAGRDKKRKKGGENSQKSHTDKQETVRRKEEAFYCDAVILCTGGMAGPSFGCSGDGYVFAQHFGHSVIRPLPALTRLECAEPFLRRAAGVRCHASVTLLEDRGKDEPGLLGREEGELQITESSISGIPVFQISAAAALLLSRGKKVCARIDFLPEFSKEAYEEETLRRLGDDRDQMLSDLLLGLVHRKVIDLVLAGEGLQAEMKARRLDDAQLRALLQRFRCFELEVTGTGGFDHAQVTSGGVPLSETDAAFSSRKCPGLYLAGELVDVDGRCGGYNLQWAMTGGVLAGRAAARYAQGRRQMPCRI